MLKYQAIADDLRSTIEDGTLKPNDRLPTVVELCDLYAVSKITVKRALDLLAEQGLIASRRGSGTYVKNTTERPDDPFLFSQSDRSHGFTLEHADASEKVDSVVYDFKIEPAPADVARHLNMHPDDFAYYHCRARLLNGTPIVLEYTYMPLDVIPGLKKHNLYGSVFSYIRDTLGLKIASFHRIVRAVKATEEEAERLQIGAGDPLLEVEQIGFLDDGTPFEYSVAHNVGDRYEIRDVNVL